MVIRLIGKTVKVSERVLLVAGSKGVDRFTIEKDGSWDGLTTVVYFRNGSTVKEVAATGGEMEIPAEVLTAGTLYVSAAGYASGVLKNTAKSVAPMLVLSGGPTRGLNSEDYSDPIWQQVLSIIGDLSELNTEAKNNLVYAINEAAKTGSGGGESGGAYTLPVAGENTLGGVMPVAKTEAMTQFVGVDKDGRLYTEPGNGGASIAGTADVGQVLEAAEVDENGNILSLRGTDRLSQLESKVEDLLYEPITITSFTNNVNVQEIGETVTSVTLNWSVNKPPASLTLDGETIDASLTEISVTDQNITANKAWSLAATDERNATARKTTAITFYNGVYYGASAIPGTVNSAFILGLTKTLSDSKRRSFTVNAGAEQYIWYCLSKRLGTCAFKVGGFDGGFNLVGTVQFTNASGYTEDYYVYRSANSSLGNTTVEVS